MWDAVRLAKHNNPNAFTKCKRSKARRVGRWLYGNFKLHLKKTVSQGNAALPLRFNCLQWWSKNIISHKIHAPKRKSPLECETVFGKKIVTCFHFFCDQRKSLEWKFFSALHVHSITCKAFCFRYIGGDGIKDVDKHKENSDQKCHASRNDFGGHQKTNPRDNNKHSRGKVVSDDVVRDFSPQRQLKSRHGVVT